MNEAKSAEVQRWLIKSQHDVGSARRLMEGAEPYLDTAVYHCQQAVEKALKAFLSYHDTAFGRTHDLTELVETCVTIDSTFASWRDVAAILTPYAVHFRYPTEVMEPEQHEAEEALAYAQSFLSFVFDRLPEDVKPCEGTMKKHPN